VALEATFQNLTLCLHHLHDALNALQVTLGDKPVNDESALADGIETVVLDLMGTLHETRTAALQARKAIGHPLDLDLARRSMVLCQERFHRMEQQFAAELASYEKLKELARLASARRIWLAWSSTVRRGIEECQPHLEQASTALAACWQEMVEHSGTTSISVRTTGQKIIARKSMDEDLVRERMT
jgi:hypothetical protein